jgi:hypothetical protein
MTIHKITMDEYKERFPNAPTTSESYKLIMSDITRDRHTPDYAPLIWNQEEALAVLHTWVKRYGVPASKDWAHRADPQGIYRPTTSVVRSLFGSWAAYLKTGGYEPRTQWSKRKRRWSRQHRKNYMRMLDKRPVRYCSVDECDSKHLAKGYCGAHYKQWKTYGRIDPNDDGRRLMSAGVQKALHIRWHVNRNIVKDDCPLCSSG